MLPKFKDYFYPFLMSIQDGDIHTVSDIRNNIVRILNLSDEDLREETKAGRNKHSDRVKWAITYLKKVDLVTSPSKCRYQITDKGLSVLKEHGSNFSLDTVRDMKGYKESSRTTNPSDSHWVEGHYRYDGTYVAGYYSNFKSQGIRKTKVTHSPNKELNTEKDVID